MAALSSLRLPVSCLAAVGLLCTLPSALGVVILNPDQTPATVPPVTTPDFPWENMAFIGQSSAIFIGDVAGNNTFWVLSAAHNGTPGTLTLAGTTYNVISTSPLNNSGISGTPDLQLFQIDMTSLPSGLINLNLPTSLTDSDTLLYMLGAGDQGGLRDKRRWGTNYADVEIGGSRVFVLSGSGRSTVSFGVQTNLNDLLPLSEGYGVSGDSGGGMFYLEDDQWYLAGIMYGVDQEGSIYYTYAADLSYYADQIRTIAAIPEPGTVAFLGLGAAGLLATRRRRR